jgi:hypothetical protein
MFSWKLVCGIFFLFTGVLSIIGVGLILLHMLDEYKKVKKERNGAKEGDIKYISEDVIEEFR